ncbi:MAG: glycosyl transferase family 36, partial [Ignavibacteriales bacterium]|nr:glycosyl transferase family 36 [Ignavibacteriales bacterium]
PEGVTKGNLNNSIGKWNDSVGAVKISLQVKPQAAEQFAFFLGLKESKEAIKTSIASLSAPSAIDAALSAVKVRWDELLGNLEIVTPDDSLNLLVNRWLRYQAIAGRLWGRTAYYQQSGAFGFRDQLQDSMVWLPVKPEETKKQIQLHARHQFKDGTVLHWWHPITETGLPTQMTDDLLWLPYLILQYIDETADYGILSASEPFYDDEKPVSLYEHSLAAFERVLSRLSERGLTLIGAGDWNDGLSAVGLDMKGESVWLTQFFYHILNRFYPLCTRHGQKDLADKYKTAAEALKKAFNEFAWDGEWYWGATKDSGEKIGSHENSEARIWLNTQTWAVLSDIAPLDMQEKAMKAVTEHLLKNYGALLIAPAYSKPDDHIGYLTRYAPGRRENGGTYTHAATWAIAAYAKLKQPLLAKKACDGINPILNGADPLRYLAEPYVTPGNIEGPDSPHYGMGGWTWYTGSAAWYQKNIVDWILGVRATVEGLKIDPCIPADWPGFTIKRFFRGTTYHIEVLNNGGQNVVIELDGQTLKSNIIPVQSGTEVHVKVYLKTN